MDFSSDRRSDTKKLHRHIFYLTIDLAKFFENYPESTLHSIPIEFSGRMRFFQGYDYVKATPVGIYVIQVPREFEHSRGLFNEIGGDKIRKVFKESLWSDYWMEQQLSYISKAQQLEFTEPELMEDF